MSEIGIRPRIRRPEKVAVRPELQEPLVTVNENPDEGAPKLSVIIPTRNETRNIEPLLDQLRIALGAIPAEIIFVDDSDDDTAEEIDRVGRMMHLPVRLLQRGPDQRVGGLGTAVVSGMKAASAPWALVMDADLQHPPEVVPQLFATAIRQNVDLVVASRYAGHGSSGGLDGSGRRNSDSSAALANPYGSSTSASSNSAPAGMPMPTRIVPRLSNML